ncbi:MAG TPA: DNA repair protein RecO [Candidatus Moranbacteria bacterium]|nr:DNA repair protein RecO [Candidatus Moranbacteria bacterium]HRZ33952.1 DNA repair protein RecO [Candidatus Moranbacteria bacterium]
MEYKYTGIILNKRDVGETDRTYTIYTLEGGKIKSLAKGVRKSNAKLASMLENITLADITIIKTKGIGKITGSIVENNFTAVKSESEAILEVFSALGLFEKLVDFENPDRFIFELLKNYLETVNICAVNKDKKKHVLLKLGFIVKLLSELGYTIEVNSCVVCSKKLSESSPIFNAKHGGTLCFSCAEKNQDAAIIVRANAIKMIRLFLQNKMNTLAKIQATKEDCDSTLLVVNEFLRWNN